MRVVFALWMREVRKYFRYPAQMIGTLGSPVMYLGVLGFGLGPIFQHLLMTEFEYAGVPGPDLTVTSIAPMIMRHGTEQNKKDFLPGIARGEIVFATWPACAPVRFVTVTNG